MKEEHRLPQTEKVEGNGSEERDLPPVRTEESFCAKLRNVHYKKRFLHTVGLFWTFVMLGWIIGQRGPSFMDLQLITNTNVEQASFFYTSSAIGYLIGSLIIGGLFNKSGRILLLASFILGNSVTTVVLPWCFSYPVMIAVFFINAVFGGGVETGANADLISVWGNDGKTFIQILHFCFTFGGVISPLVTEPFLAPRYTDNQASLTQDDVFYNSQINQTGTNQSGNAHTTDVLRNTSVNTNHVAGETKIHFAYLISGILGITSSLPFCINYCRNKKESRQSSTNPEISRAESSPLPLRLYIPSLVALSVFYYFHSAVVDTFFGYLLIFVVQQLDWTKADGAVVTSTYWASLAVGRFSGIFVINYLQAVTILMSCCTFSTVCFVAMIISGLYNVHAMMWFCAIGIGLSLSVIYPTGFTWTEAHLLRVSGKVAAIVTIAGTSAGMINPLILGHLMETSTPMWYLYLLLMESGLCLGIFIFLLIWSKTVVKNYHVQVLTDRPYEESEAMTDNTNQDQ